MYLVFSVFDLLIAFRILSCCLYLSLSLCILRNWSYISSNFLTLISVLSSLMLHLSPEFITFLNFQTFHLILSKTNFLIINFYCLLSLVHTFDAKFYHLENIHHIYFTFHIRFIHYFLSLRVAFCCWFPRVNCHFKAKLRFLELHLWELLKSRFQQCSTECICICFF